MKKLALLLMMLLPLGVLAADFQLLFGSNRTKVEPGITYQTGYTLTSIPVGPMTMDRYEQSSDLYIKAPAGLDMTVEVTATSPVQICSLDGLCETEATTGKKVGQVGVKQSPVAGTVDVYPLLIDHATVAQSGTTPTLSDITVTVKVYPTNDPAQVQTATVIMRALSQSEIGSVGEIASDNTLPATYYDLLGNRVTPPLRPGIYVRVQGGKATKHLIGK